MQVRGGKARPAADHDVTDFSALPDATQRRDGHAQRPRRRIISQ